MARRISQTHHQTSLYSGRRAFWSAVVVAGLFTIACACVISFNLVNLRALTDQQDYHLKVIEQFSQQWPKPDLRNYRSATTPGYHLALAPIHRFVSDDTRLLRGVSSVFTIALLAVLAAASANRTNAATAIAISLPALTSIYMFSSGAWLLPDNLAWLGIALAMLLVQREHVDRFTYIAAAILMGFLVLVRQTNLWVIPVFIAYVALPARGDAAAPRILHRKRMHMMGASALPALALLAWFVWLWGGLTPPSFQTFEDAAPPGHSGWMHEGPNLAVPAMILAVFAVTGVFYAGFLLSALSAKSGGLRASLGLIIIGVFIGALAAIVVPTSWNDPAGRYSGLWNIAKYFPTFADRSILMIFLSSLGGGLAASWLCALERRDRWTFLIAWLAFSATQTANAMAWHKYYEPFALIMLVLWTTRLAQGYSPPRWAIYGPVLLSILLGCVTVLSMRPG